MSSLLRPLCLSLFACAVTIAATARAQFQLPTNDQLQGFKATADKAGKDEHPLSVKAVVSQAESGQGLRLYVVADIKPGWHIYSLTQASGGPIPTKIKLTNTPDFRVTGEFTPSPAPLVHTEPDAYGDLLLEEHSGRVIWQAPIELIPGVDPSGLKIAGKLSAQACDANNYRPPHDFPFVAQLGTPPPETTSENPAGKQAANDSGKPRPNAVYSNPKTHATIRGTIEPHTVSPGGKVRLTLTAEPADQWHVYALADKVPTGASSRPTLIVFTETSGFQTSRPKPDRAPIEKRASGPGEFDQLYYEGPVSWTVDLHVPADTPPGDYAIAGIIGFQTCWPNNCDLPTAADFQGTVKVGEPRLGSGLLTFTDGRYSEAAKLAAASATSSLPPEEADATTSSAFDPTQIRSRVAEEGSNASMPLMLLFGFLGGLILNLMPCVLPVIGLKVLSFVEQSGQDRSRVLWLNIWYSLGLMSVFWVLAALAVTLGLGWGEQFGSATFNIVMAGIVFAMGLSFLGVWEIPIPGFVGSGKANDLAAKEGVAGAFAKGVVTTILATPCTGPFLGTSLAWAVRQPPTYTILLFTFVGLGMASPYLLIGAFPGLVKFLPKPGMWMETFKQLMGFVLLATVVFLLTFIEWSLVVPTVALLFGIWAACWWVGRTPYTADFGVKLRSWAVAATLTAAVGLVSFAWLQPEMELRLSLLVDRAVGQRLNESGKVAAKPVESTHRLPWQPFSPQALRDLTGEQRTVMVDFTADWCLICKVLEKTVLNTPDVKKVIDEQQVVPLLADWTNRDQEVADMMEVLGAKMVPVLAIFPAGRPNEPIVFNDPYTQQQLIAALEQAGPSKSPETKVSTLGGDGPAAELSRR